MQFDRLPVWAQTALISRPPFGSEGEEGESAAVETDAGKAGAPPEKTVEENNNPQLTPEQIAKILRENAEAKANLSAYEQEKTEREAAEEEARRATASKEENLSKDVARLTEENQTLSLVNERNILKIAILENSKYQWNDPADVAVMIDRGNIKIDPAKGSIEGIEEALKDLAKRKPYMLKPSEDNSGNNNGNGAGSFVPGQPSGGKPGSSADASAKATRRKALETRFSVLRT